MNSNTPKGPRSTDHGAAKNDLEFDPDSPDPTGPAKAPNNPKSDSTAKENPYSPDFKSPPIPKPQKDADIDTPSG